MANTYTLIGSAVITSNTAYVNFNNISQNYTDLVLKGSIRTNAAAAIAVDPSLLFNNASGTTNYNHTYTQGYNATITGGTSLNQSEAGYRFGVNDSGSTADTFSSHEFYFPNYGNSIRKQFTYFNSTENNSVNAYIVAQAQYYASTSAISSINISIGAGAYNFLAGSVYYLYGIWKGTGTTLPSTPTIGTATATSGTTATVAFTPTSATGVDVSYTALSTPGSITATGTSSPVTVTGLTTGTAYTFQVRANNPGGSSAYSAASNSVTPEIPGAYESIATFTPTSGTQIEFTSIPSGYASLQLRINLFTPSNQDYPVMRFNNDNTSIYSAHYWAATGGGTVAGGTGAASSISTFLASEGTSPTRPNVIIIDLFDYASTTKYKTVKWMGGQCGTGGAGVINVGGGQWRSNSAITSLLISNTFSSGTSIALYGLKGA